MLGSSESFLILFHLRPSGLRFRLTSSFASRECFARRRLPTRAEWLGDFGIRHEEVKSMKGTSHDQEFGCDSGMDEPARVHHVFFDEQVDCTDTDPDRW
jgi:hypothetical protein